MKGYIVFERISIELTNQCSKGCCFCYNDSRPDGKTFWAISEVVDFVRDCAANGVQAVSFGGGEPLEYDGVYDVLRRLDGVLFRSVTTNGLLLDQGALRSLVDSRPDKVHVSLHFPQSRTEVARVIRHVRLLQHYGVRTGVNILVARSQLESVRKAAQCLSDAGIEKQQIVYLPMRGTDTPSADELGSIAATKDFQSMTCLKGCGASSRFCSIGWDKTIGWCSYTESRRMLKELTFYGLCEAMNGIGLRPCDKSLVQLQVNSHDSLPVQKAHVSDSQASSLSDYPAAHSMDTEWFATDREGNVALLETGEPGLMPKVLEETHGVEYWGIVDDVLLSDESGIQYFLDDLFEFGEGVVLRAADWRGERDANLSERLSAIADVTQIGDEEAGSKTPGFFSRLIEWGPGRPQRSKRTWHKLQVDAVCWLRDVSVVGQLPKTARLLHVGGKVVAWVPRCPAKLLRKLYDEKVVLGVMAEEWYPAAHRFGFYVYECDDYDEGPYDRVAVPRRPIKVEELPEAARQASERVRFDEIVFAQTEKLQPADYVPCFAWGSGWKPEEG